MTESANRASCLWLYAVVSRTAPLPPPITGVAGEQVGQICEAGLAALVGRVPSGEFGQPAVRSNLEDLDWLAAVARAHDAVVRSAMGGGAVVPVRLVTLFSDEAAVRALLRARSADFTAALGRLAGRTEWGVKVFDEPRADARDEPGTADAAAGSGTAGAGAAYLLGRRAALAERERAERAAAAFGEHLHADLARVSVAGRRHPLSAAVAREAEGRLLLNGAYLVEDAKFDSFREAVDTDSADTPLRVELTGPWPAYSFAAVAGVTDA